MDSQSEQKVHDAMKKLMKGRLSIIIAHRLSTIREANMILVVDHGHIVEQGKHEELLARKSFYAELYNSQFGFYETVTNTNPLIKT
jgi:ATP-binding cassette subfamily B protein